MVITSPWMIILPVFLYYQHLESQLPKTLQVICHRYWVGPQINLLKSTRPLRSEDIDQN